jgi:hypothetical protein
MIREFCAWKLGEIRAGTVRRWQDRGACFMLVQRRLPGGARRCRWPSMENGEFFGLRSSGYAAKLAIADLNFIRISQQWS